MNYGTLSRKSMKSPNNGKSLEFDFVGSNRFFETSIYRKWIPDLDKLSFKPMQMHFHRGLDHKHVSKMGSEHTLNDHHYGMEMHLVSLNFDDNTKHDFGGEVTAILFKQSSSTQPTWADTLLVKLLTTDDNVDMKSELIDHLDFNHRFAFRGGLTTPPFTEHILWNVLETVVEL